MLWSAAFGATHPPHSLPLMPGAARAIARPPPRPPLPDFIALFPALSARSPHSSYPGCCLCGAAQLCRAPTPHGSANAMACTPTYSLCLPLNTPLGHVCLYAPHATPQHCNSRSIGGEGAEGSGAEQAKHAGLQALEALHSFSVGLWSAGSTAAAEGEQETRLGQPPRARPCEHA